MLVLAVSSACRRSPEAKKANFLQSGKAFMQAKDYPRAILQFQNAAQFAGKDPEPYYQLALALLADGQLKSGIVALKQAVLVNPKYSPARLKLAELETSVGTPENVAEAARTLQDLITQPDENAEALSTLGMAEIRLGKETEGIKDLEEALQKSPANLKAAVTMARVRFQHRDLKGAEEVLQSAVKQAPKSADALVALASFYLATQRMADAERSLQQALQIDPKSDSALLSLAAVQLRSNEKDQAEQTYARISALGPARYKPVHAQFLFQEGKRDAAIAEFAKLAKDSPDDRAARTRLVAAYWIVNRKADAEKVLTEALKHNPRDVDALTQRAQMEVAANRLAEAQADTDQVLRMHPESAQAHFIKASIYRGRGDFALERQELGETLRLKKDMLVARIQLARALLQQHDAKAALALLQDFTLDDKNLSQRQNQDATERQKSSFPVFVVRNYALLELGDFDQVQKNLEPVLPKVKTPDLLLQDAMVKGNKKDYNGALASLQAILKANPEDLRALELLVKVYYNQHQVPQATARIRECVAARPNSAMLQKFLGDWLVATGDHNGAIQAYTAAKQLNPQLTSADMAMVRIYIADNKNDQARQILTRLLQSGNGNADTFLWMGVLEERSGNVNAAIAQYRKVLNIESNNIMALNNLAFLLADHGQGVQLDEALKLAQQVRSLVPKSANVDDTMGWVYYKKGILNSAIQQLREAVKEDEDKHTPSALHHYHLAIAYLTSGDRKQGNDELNTATKLNPNLPEAKQAQTILAQAKTASN